MTTPDPFTEAARAEAQVRWPSYPSVGFSGADDRQHAFREGASWARARLATQEPVEPVLMDSHEEQIADRLSDAGYTEYAEDEDGGLTWVSAPLGEVLRIVSAAHQPIEDASARAVRSWRAMHQVAEEERDQALAALESDPSDAEVEAAKAVLDSVEYADEPQSIRAALSAARAARRDEEKR